MQTYNFKFDVKQYEKDHAKYLEFIGESDVAEPKPDPTPWWGPGTGQRTPRGVKDLLKRFGDNEEVMAILRDGLLVELRKRQSWDAWREHNPERPWRPDDRPNSWKIEAQAEHQYDGVRRRFTN